jgi:hypothetical protein
MFRTFTKKRSIVALSLIAVLALAGGAYAYFSTTGQGTGTVTVGSASTFTVTPQGATGGPLLPGNGTEVIGYTVANASTSGNQQLNTTTAKVNSSGGNVTTGNGSTVVTGCQASWFSVTNTPPTAQVLAPSGTASGSVSISLSDPGVNQDKCQGVSPDVVINAS